MKTKAPGQENPATLDFATVAGIALALAGVVGGLLMEGGDIKDIAQLTAAMIVTGGTLGAVLVTTPVQVLRGAARRFSSVFYDRRLAPEAYIEELLGFAARARKGGIASLEQEVRLIPDPFLRKALTLGIDGTEIKELKAIMQLQIDMDEHAGITEAKVYEAAGGYAPTVGIIGAVLGLIQVMKNLENIEEVGHGIAVAFVATVYGVGLANLFLLPAASKIKSRVKQAAILNELVLEGVCSIVEGLNPQMIKQKLEAFTQEQPRTGIVTSS
ncbi:MAG TPA: flagellar motor protein [Bryobacteraceae bacterium]|nr:flagellar motor protein [Bryobacteraceae bacterium]